MIPWLRWRRVVVLSRVGIFACLALWLYSKLNVPANNSDDLQRRYPLLWSHVHTFNGNGGAWYIPQDWSPGSGPKTIVEAAQLAFHAANSSTGRVIAHSSIPLIIHETWKNTRIDTWSDEIRRSAEKWLEYAVNEGMAYFLWDDDGIKQLLNFYDPGFMDKYSALTLNAEKADVFRVLVSKWIGGIYGDIDTEPLQSPANWIKARDIEPWEDHETGAIYNSSGPVKAIIGLEADCPPDGDSYWRMGYEYPVQ